MTTNEADFTFHGDLEWFFGSHHHGNNFHLVFEDHQSIKHLVEALGVPHVEVGRVTANGKVVGLETLPHDHDLVEVFPPEPGLPTAARFLLDNHLGRLAALLRILGFDSLYRNDFQDDEMAEILSHDERILLTRDRQLLMRKVVRYGMCLRSLKPEEQLGEVVRRFQLAPLIQPFTRCLRCNGALEPVEKSAVLDQLEPKTKLYYELFARCSSCGQVYWQGSHWERMRRMVEQISKQ